MLTLLPARPSPQNQSANQRAEGLRPPRDARAHPPGQCSGYENAAARTACLKDIPGYDSGLRQVATQVVAAARYQQASHRV